MSSGLAAGLRPALLSPRFPLAPASDSPTELITRQIEIGSAHGMESHRFIIQCSLTPKTHALVLPHPLWQLNITIVALRRLIPAVGSFTLASKCIWIANTLHRLTLRWWEAHFGHCLSDFFLADGCRDAAAHHGRGRLSPEKAMTHNFACLVWHRACRAGQLA